MKKSLRALFLPMALVEDLFEAPFHFNDYLTKRFVENDGEIFGTPAGARAYAWLLEAPLILFQGHISMGMAAFMGASHPMQAVAFIAGIGLLTPLSMKFTQAVLDKGDSYFGKGQGEQVESVEIFPALNKAWAEMRLQ